MTRVRVKKWEFLGSEAVALLHFLTPTPKFQRGKLWPAKIYTEGGRGRAQVFVELWEVGE